VPPLIPYLDPPVILFAKEGVKQPAHSTVLVRIPLPEFFPVERVPLYGFGILVALGFMFGSRVAMNRAKRIGLDPEQINHLVGWLVVGTFVGGHVGYGLMYEPAEFFANPRRWLEVWDGLSSWGGFLVCVPLSVYFFRSRKLDLWPYLDCLAIGLGLGWGFGRLGCFVAHDHPGPPTTFPLSVYPTYRADGSLGSVCDAAMPGVACFDLGLLESLWSFAAFGIMLVLDRKARVPGFYPLLLALMYGPVRFVMEFLRGQVSDPRYAGFTPAQWWSLVAIVLCAGLFYRRLRSGDAPVWTPPGTKV
jgi:phosphatidylglycerol:prolipoprotein diacylglycerol transferase